MRGRGVSSAPGAAPAGPGPEAAAQRVWGSSTQTAALLCEDTISQYFTTPRPLQKPRP